MICVIIQVSYPILNGSLGKGKSSSNVFIELCARYELICYLLEVS
ncbi:hypothetical protein F383_23021 [Gossypium arboreum]|uniref:Uncharacterized protein n=1 Tax=Gossypium arboreum TaxID=29729 RepID=A0A0B0NSH1_GOSAR|nr:hypothetical protein F383_23021 [Gossypium arboreum]